MGFVFAGIVVLLIGAALLFFGRRSQAKTNLLKSVPTSSAADVANLMPGELVEIKGTVRCDQPLTGEYSQKPCVWYTSSMSREYEERSKDAQGNWQTSRGSETVSSNTQATPFFVEDSSGRVRVDPDGADFDAETIVDRFDTQSADTGPLGGVSIDIGGINIGGSGNGRRTLGYRYKEQAIPVDIPIYVLGARSESGDVVKPPPGSGGRFIVSHRSEESLSASWGKTAHWLAYSAIALFVIGAILLVAGVVTMVS